MEKKRVSGGRALLGTPSDCIVTSIGKPNTASSPRPRTEDVWVTAFTTHLGRICHPAALSA
eukprot:2598377-Prymnesium_polylepis.1